MNKFSNKYVFDKVLSNELLLDKTLKYTFCEHSFDRFRFYIFTCVNHFLFAFAVLPDSKALKKVVGCFDSLKCVNPLTHCYSSLNFNKTILKMIICLCPICFEIMPWHNLEC